MADKPFWGQKAPRNLGEAAQWLNNRMPQIPPIGRSGIPATPVAYPSSIHQQGGQPSTQSQAAISPLAPPASPLAALNANNQRANSTPMAFSPPANVAPGRNSLVTQARPVEQYEFQHPNPFHVFDQPSAPSMPAARDSNAGLRDLNDRLRALNQANEARNRSGGLSPYVPTGDTAPGTYANSIAAGMKLPSNEQAAMIQGGTGYQPRTTVGGRFGEPAGISPYTESQIPRDVATSRLGNQRESSLYDISHPGQTPFAPKPLPPGPSYAGTFTNRNRYVIDANGALTPNASYANELNDRRTEEAPRLAANRQAYLERRGQVAKDRQDSIRNGTIITPAQRRLATRNAQAQTDFERALGAKNPLAYASITNNRNDNTTRSKIDDSETLRQTGRNQTQKDIAGTQADATKYGADRNLDAAKEREKWATDRTDKTTQSQERIAAEQRKAEEARVQQRRNEFQEKLDAEARLKGIDPKTGLPIEKPLTPADAPSLSDLQGLSPAEQDIVLKKYPPATRGRIKQQLQEENRPGYFSKLFGLSPMDKNVPDRISLYHPIDRAFAAAVRTPIPAQGHLRDLQDKPGDDANTKRLKSELRKKYGK